MAKEKAYKVLVSTKGMPHNEWLKWRLRGIGGSDAPILTGHSKYGSRWTLWMQKTGQSPEEEQENEFMYWGNVMEPILAKEFERRTGLKVKRVNAILQSIENPFMIANLDRVVVGENVGLEIKTASEYLSKQWDGDTLPDQYYIQAMHYMAVTGYDAWWVAVLIGGNKFQYKLVKRDDAFIEELIRIESDFWLHNVIEKKMPEIDGSEVASAFLKAKYPDANGQEIDIDDIAELITDYGKCKDELKECKAAVDELENRIKLRLGEFERGRCQDKLVTWKNIESRRFDSTRFAKEHPSLYEQFVNVSSSRRFEVK